MQPEKLVDGQMLGDWAASLVGIPEWLAINSIQPERLVDVKKIRATRRFTVTGWARRRRMTRAARRLAAIGVTRRR
jgi:hypothetical protein